MTEQMTSLVNIAKTQHQKLFKLIGQPVEDWYPKNKEKIQLYVQYPEKFCKYNGQYWDIPEYTNGSTRHVKALFRLDMMACGDAEYAYRGSWDEINEKLKGCEREKLLIKEYIDGNLVELIWSYDMKAPEQYGQHWYSVDYFWFAAKINGIVYQKHKDINDLVIPPLKQKCIACERELSISRLTYMKGIGHNPNYWICTDIKKNSDECES